MAHKKGIGTMMLVVYIFIVFFIVITAGVMFYSVDLIDDTILTIPNISIGEINFRDSYNDTLGAGLRSFANTLSGIALVLVLGMVGVMVIMAYFLQEKNRLLVILDIFIIIVVFIPAVYLSQTFETFINATPEFLDIFSNEFHLPSRFLLNLPLIVPITGVLIMLATHIAIKRREPNVLAY